MSSFLFYTLRKCSLSSWDYWSKMSRLLAGHWPYFLICKNTDYQKKSDLPKYLEKLSKLSWSLFRKMVDTVCRKLAVFVGESWVGFFVGSSSPNLFSDDLSFTISKNIESPLRNWFSIWRIWMVNNEVGTCHQPPKNRILQKTVFRKVSISNKQCFLNENICTKLMAFPVVRIIV